MPEKFGGTHPGEKAPYYSAEIIKNHTLTPIFSKPGPMDVYILSFLLPSSFFLLPSSFFLLTYSDRRQIYKVDLTSLFSFESFLSGTD